MVLVGLSFLYIGDTHIMNILGTEYELIHDDTLEEVNQDGCCKIYTKEIRIRNVESMLDDADSEKDKKTRYDEVARHEIIHAFFFESGNPDWCDDEKLVNWIAMQFPKMLQVFQEYGCV